MDDDQFLLCEEVCDMTPCTNLDHKNGFLEDASGRFLLCDEVWDMSPALPSAPPHHTHDQHHHNLVQPITKEDCQHSFATCLGKEIKYMPPSGYIHLLQSNRFLATCRSKAIQWFIHSQRRFNFCIETVYNAANYVDRFIHINQCHGWNHWMMELLSVASLSIAIKFCETGRPSLRELQEDQLEYSFDAKLIQRMELKMLECLGWELNCITPHSYVDLITWELNSLLINPHINLHKLTSRLNHLLLASSLDEKLLVYRPCVIVMSGLRFVLEEFFPSTCQDYLSHITTFLNPPPDQTQNLQSCYRMMHQILDKSEADANPTSPDTVLTKEQVPISIGQVDLSFIDEPDMKKGKLKKKMEDQDQDPDMKKGKLKRTMEEGDDSVMKLDDTNNRWMDRLY